MSEQLRQASLGDRLKLLEENAKTFNDELAQIETRDDRFRTLLEAQFGKNGIFILVTQTILFIFALIIIVAVVIASININMKNQFTRKSSKSPSTKQPQPKRSSNNVFSLPSLTPSSTIKNYPIVV